MRNSIIFLGSFLCLFATQAQAQTFEERAKSIADKIENVTREEKTALKAEVEAVNLLLERGEINMAEADERKMKLAQARAKNIETGVGAAQEELNELIKDKVDGKIRERDSVGRFSISIKSPAKPKDPKKNAKPDSRTTTQFIFATGANNVVTNGNVSHSDFQFNKSMFYEWGLSMSTRLLNNNNLLQGKYGLSLMYNNLRPTENRYFVTDANQTYLVQSDVALKHSRLRNVYLSVPVHLEFDFGRQTADAGFKKQQGWRMGIGGYGGARIKSKQVLRYELDGDDITEKRKGDFNATSWIYGVSSYIGYKNVGLYVKYDLNPLFEHNLTDQNNVSMGIRFDFN
jgi:predicted RNA-binding protein with RPS1 domain